MVTSPKYKSDAGKGCLYRSVDWVKYGINYDAYHNPPPCELCETLMKQWKAGQTIFMCPNENCKQYLMKIDKGD